ncbi:MAG: hypothetical protein QM539_10155 [Alphaproteobacteria bacterium]|nr:hypothetical protein [Alphaproteobacteria bacterium]
MKLILKFLLNLIIIVYFTNCEPTGTLRIYEYPIIFINQSNYHIDIFQYDTSLKVQPQLLYQLNKNDSLILKYEFRLNDPPYTVFPKLFESPVKIIFNNTKEVILKNIPFNRNLELTSQNPSKYQSIFNYGNYTKSAGILTYTFTEKDYLMADSIVK